jgi:hypothetical protein
MKEIDFYNESISKSIKRRKIENNAIRYDANRGLGVIMSIYISVLNTKKH